MKDHQIRELVNQLRDIAVKYHAAGQLRERIAHVIRAAMLQTGTFRGNVNSSTNNCREISETSTNSPEIPDCWISVSERMPGRGGAYLVWNGKHIGAVSLFFGSFQCFNPEQITHWRHLPAAPQELKS